MENRKFFLLGLGFVGIILTVSVFFGFKFFANQQNLVSPFINSEIKSKNLPLLKYTVANLKNFPFKLSEIKIEEKIADYEGYTSSVFSYLASGGTISGQINLPDEIKNPQKIIILLRGYVDPEIYKTGMGTSAAAAVFAQQGYVTLSPDFLGFGQSSPESTDSWETRFIKPVNAIELLHLVQKTDFKEIACQAKLVVGDQVQLQTEQKSLKVCSKTTQFQNKIGFWAHSNGGQIALTTLEGLQESIPTTLWAPVTAPFPYSVLFFTDELWDEGKATRKWLALFEDDYNVFDFSVSKNLDKLRGVIQLHHGTADEAALWSWSSEFVKKVELENENRLAEIKLLEDSLLEASLSAQEKSDLELRKADLSSFGQIDLNFFSYPGADHNLRPYWDQVMVRDLEFFAENLK